MKLDKWGWISIATGALSFVLGVVSSLAEGKSGES